MTKRSGGVTSGTHLSEMPMYLSYGAGATEGRFLEGEAPFRFLH